jgi:hypothetical protein
MNVILRNLVNNRNFWANVEGLANILEPAKNAVKSVERKNTTMADIFVALIQMALAIKSLPTESSDELKDLRLSNFIIIGGNNLTLNYIY